MYLAGHDLLRHMQLKQRFSEKDVADVARALIATVAYCHQNGGAARSRAGAACAAAPRPLAPLHTDAAALHGALPSPPPARPSHLPQPPCIPQAWSTATSSWRTC